MTSHIDTAAAATSTDPVAHLDDFDEGTMKMVRVDGHRICLARTTSGVHAIDNACPHEGYGLTQGSLDGELVTCQWHNWKFRVSDGTCVLGEEAVTTHDVNIDDDGAVRVTVNRPDPAERRPQLRESLQRGIEKNYIGQVARDVVRLLQASENPGELIWEAVAFGAPRGEFGWGHSIASATDCLQMVDLYEGDQRALPIVQGIAGIAETERQRPVQPLPDPASAAASTMRAFRDAVEREELATAQAVVLGALESGATADDLIPWFTSVVTDHHLSYGHGAIYSQKAFEMLDMIGWQRAGTVLPHLVPTLVYGTREDTLPYMRPFTKTMYEVDLATLVDAETTDQWADDGSLLEALLGADRALPATAVGSALRAGAGVDGVLDVVVAAVSERMLRYDTDGEVDFHDDFGWLDITHGMTYANAVRWHHQQAVESGAGTSPDLLRLLMYTAFLANWTGRHEWHTTIGPRHEVDLDDSDIHAIGQRLQRESLMDGTTAFIVHAHAVKTSRAAALEAARANSVLPLQATARFMAAPKLERFVAATVARSVDFLNGRTQRD